MVQGKLTRKTADMLADRATKKVANMIAALQRDIPQADKTDVIHAIVTASMAQLYLVGFDEGNAVAHAHNALDTALERLSVQESVESSIGAGIVTPVPKKGTGE